MVTTPDADGTNIMDRVLKLRMPITVSSYDSSIFSSLPDFRTASHALDRMRGDLQVLGKIICRHNFEEHIGITLLHKHFSILSSERLIKRFVGNRAYIRPYSQPINDNVVPCVWKFERNQTTGVQRFYPLEFVDTTHRAFRGRADAQIFVSSEAFLAEISAVLCALNAENVFGLCTLYGNGEIVLGDREILLETTDYMDRVLTLASAAKTSTETTETSWQFMLNKDGDDTTKCKGHCKVHCKNHK